MTIPSQAGNNLSAPGIISQLEGVSADKAFGRTDKPAKDPLIIFDKSLIVIVRRIAGHAEKRRDHVLIAAGSLGVAGQILKDQPFAKRMERSGHLTQTVGRSDDEAVCGSDGVKHRSKSVPAYAPPSVPLSFAPEAGDAAGIFFKFEQIELLNLRPLDSASFIASSTRVSVFQPFLGPAFTATIFPPMSQHSICVVTSPLPANSAAGTCPPGFPARREPVSGVRFRFSSICLRIPKKSRTCRDTTHTNQPRTLALASFRPS